MATTVEAKTREQAPAPAPAATKPWYQARQRHLVAGLVVLAVAAIVGWFVMASGKRKEQFAARSLNQARAAAEAGNLPLASSELQRLITTYKGTDAASEAVITLNQVRMVNGQSELAAVGLREFLATKPPAAVCHAGHRPAGRRAGELQALGGSGQRLYPGLERRGGRVPEGELSGGRRPGLPGRRQAGGRGQGLSDGPPEVSRCAQLH